MNSSQVTWKTLQQGTATHVVAAFDPSIVGKQKFLHIDSLMISLLIIYR